MEFDRNGTTIFAVGTQYGNASLNFGNGGNIYWNGSAFNFNKPVQTPGGTNPVISTTSAITSGAAAAAGTLTNAPVAGNPTKWIPISDNGTTRYIPSW